MSLADELKKVPMKIEERWTVNFVSAYLMLKYPNHRRLIFWIYLIINISLTLVLLYVITHVRLEYAQEVQACWDRVSLLTQYNDSTNWTAMPLSVG